MSKVELVNFIAEEAGLTKADATRALDAMQKGITEGLKKEGKVTLTGFVTFTAKAKEAKVGRNPKTGEAVQVPAKDVLKAKIK